MAEIARIQEDFVRLNKPLTTLLKRQQVVFLKSMQYVYIGIRLAIEKKIRQGSRRFLMDLMITVL